MEFLKFDSINIYETIQEDVKYQDIIYYKWNTKETISSDQNKRIRYEKAVTEMEGLDWNFAHNHIGFINKMANLTIQFVRLEKDKWYAENIILHQGMWTGSVWYCEADNKTIKEMVKLFFEENPRWCDFLAWKFKRVSIS